MIEITAAQILAITFFFAGSCISLVIYIYNGQNRKITKVQGVQEKCPINKIYTVLETLKTDITWIKKTIEKQ